VKTNLGAKRLRLIFLADEIPANLRTIVEFLNEQMTSSEVLAIEVRQHQGGELTTLVSELIGNTSTALSVKGTRGPTRSWDEESFFDELRTRTTGQGFEAARRLHAWGSSRIGVRIHYGQGAKVGNMMFELDIADQEARWLNVATDGSCGLHPNALAHAGRFATSESRQEYIRHLGQALDKEFSPEVADDSYLKLQLDAIGDAVRLERFVQVQDWVVNEVAALYEA
jgi:hypothetical protein